MGKNAAVIAALRSALEADPRNGDLWLHLAQLHEDDGDLDDALSALQTAAELADFRREALRAQIPLLRRAGRLAEALIRVESALSEEEDPILQRELQEIETLRARASEPDAAGAVTPSVAPDPAPSRSDASEPARVRARATQPGEDQEWASQFDWGELRLRFDDVVGLEEIKRQIRLRIIAPFEQPEVYDAFHREAGGGILLYGPPGCGKTFIARATAGELGARFVSVGIHDLVDSHWGESEKLVHSLFEGARRKSPTVLFFDEFDALGGSRGGGSDSRFWRSVIDQLLQEMDGIRGRNREVLIFAATNMPWGVDPAFRRPGRFDRVFFVPPPDQVARRGMLENWTRKLPGHEALDLDDYARRTDSFTGADLRALCERASERALEQSLESGRVKAITRRDFDRALKRSSSTAAEWFAAARNHARYGNEGGQYDELVDYLKRVKRW